MSYREERRRDDAARAEQERENKRLELEAQLAARREIAEQKRKDDEARAEQKRRDEEAKAERQRKEAEARRRQEQAEKRERDKVRQQRKAIRAAKRAKLRAWMKKNPVTLFVAFVMVASVVPAVISQVAALSGAKVYLLLAVLLAAMLEGGAWAMTFMGKAAEDAGRPTGKYRTGTWVLAFIAAGINYWHWADHLKGEHQWVPWVFAGSSLLAILLWDMKVHGSHGRTKEERRAARARRKQDRDRKKRFPEVWVRFEDLLAAHPHGGLDRDAAWRAAWRDVHGADLGLTAAVLTARLEADRVLADVLDGAGRTPEQTAVELLLTELFPLRSGGEDGPGGSPSMTPPGGPSKGGPEAATTLGGKGKQATATVAKTDDDRPLEDADLEAVRALADQLGDARKLSSKNVRQAVGCRTKYALRLRDAVKAERGV